MTKSRSLKAVAAAALVALALIVARRPHETTPPAAADRIPAAADLLTAGHLNAACRRGGLEAMNRQCEEAARRLDNRPEKVSAEDLIRELNEIQASKG